MESLAKEVFGLRNVVATEALSGGMSNRGLFSHQIGKIRVVEKITVWEREITIAEHLAHKGCATLPCIYEIRRRGKEAHIFMEFIPRVGIIPAPTLRICRALSAAMLAIHRDLDSLDLPRTELSSDTLFQSLKALPTQIDIGIAEKVIPSLVNKSHRLPSVVCHNDILWPNVSVSESWLRAECRFIDFGLAGPNCLGADLHHFAGRAAVGIDKEMFDGLVVTFSKQAAASEYDVRFGARFYALRRVVSRMAYHACRGQRKRLRRDRATFAALLALLQ